MFKKNKESPTETRNALLVVVVLIITITFQAGVSPPSHILNTIQGQRETRRLALLFFYLPNTVGLFAPTVLLIILTTRFPLRLPLYISMVALWFTYLSSTGEAVGYLLAICIGLTGVVSSYLFFFLASKSDWLRGRAAHLTKLNVNYAIQFLENNTNSSINSIGNYPTPNLEDLNHKNHKNKHKTTRTPICSRGSVKKWPTSSELWSKALCTISKNITPSMSPYNEIHTPRYIIVKTSITLEEKIC